MKKLRINYFDGNYAICEDEDGNIDARIPKYQLPLDSEDGDYIFRDEAGMYQLYEEDSMSPMNIIEKIKFKHKGEN